MYKGRGGRNTVVNNSEKIKPKGGGKPNQPKKKYSQMKENITIKSQKSFLRFKNVILNVGACLGGGGGVSFA